MLIGGSPAIRGAILVVSAVDGVTAEAEAEIRLASQMRVPTVVTFLNKAEKVKDPELIEICEMEIREILTDCGYAEAESPIIVGDAEKACNYKGQNLNSDHWKTDYRSHFRDESLYAAAAESTRPATVDANS